MILKQLDLLNFSIISPHILKENLVKTGKWNLDILEIYRKLVFKNNSIKRLFSPKGNLVQYTYH